MPVHVTNWEEADIGTAVAAANMDQGSVCVVDGSGLNRRLTVLGNSDDSLVVSGNVAVAQKVSADPYEVDSSTALARLGSRISTILKDDLIMEIRKGAKIRYTVDLLDASLDPDNGGATPAIGADLGIHDGKFSTVSAAGTGITSPVVGRVHKVFGTDVVIELVY